MSAFSHYGGLFLQGSSDDKQRLITLAVFDLAVLASVQLCLYDAGRAAPDYFAGIVQFEYVGESTLYWLQAVLGI